jgi:hypothetical protein
VSIEHLIVELFEELCVPLNDNLLGFSTAAGFREKFLFQSFEDELKVRSGA